MAYYNNGDNVVLTLAKGSTETEFTSATFKAMVTTYGTTGPMAKEKALPCIEAIKRAIVSYGETVGIDMDRLKTSFSVDIHHARNTGEFAGYKANYTITFTGRNVVEALKLHDALTSIEGVEAPTPIFNLNDSADVHARAFADAVAKARIKFQSQCAALDIDPNMYETTSWSIQEEEPRGKMLSFSEGAQAKPVGLEPGKAVFDMKVTFVHRLKAS